MKMYAKKLPPSSTLTAFAPARVLFWKIRSGISGASTRVSMTRKAASRAAEVASSVTVRTCPSRPAGRSRSRRPAVTGRRSRRPRRTGRSAGVLGASRLSGTTRGASSSAAAPMGTLRKKMYCQPA